VTKYLIPTQGPSRKISGEKSGLAGVPRGQVKRLRVIAYHYAYRNMSDDSRAIGVNSSWDTVKVVLGTVPVHEDGSVLFRVPACTPISIQPLDARGQALQLMRSWTTAMPGETQSCVGCHAAPKQVAPAGSTHAQRRGISEIAPWYGPPRGFSFQREVQPVLDRHCAGCHDGKPRADDQRIPNFTRQKITDERGFSPSYLELQRYVRRPGAETDFHMLAAAEYHASTSELVQLLERGHHGVRLDAEAWERLATWIDLNVPYHGTWQEAQGCDRVGKQGDQRRELLRRYTGIDVDPEAVPAQDAAPLQPMLPPPRVRNAAPPVRAEGWPFDAAEARRRQAASGPRTTRSLDLGNGVKLVLVLVPAGEFVMGDPAAATDEELPRRVRISRPFWMGKLEVTNEQFARFDPRHDSRHVQTFGITSDRGYPLNRPAQPVARVSWERATAFCSWLSEKTGERFTLPTEEQWEYACRAGTASPFFHGGLDTDFGRWANFGDRNLEHLRDYSHSSKQAWLPRDERFDDGQLLAAPVGTYLPNAWGLHDMHGNVWEWTTSKDGEGRRVVRGGSWYDRPARCTSSFRLGYPAWQGVFNIGFRVACEP
jgi:formylglycine-generating enzyme required for sulfatase activity